MESHILYIFAAALVTILGGAVAAIVKIFNMTEKSREKDRATNLKYWRFYMETFNESLATNKDIASALEKLHQIEKTRIEGDNNG